MNGRVYDPVLGMFLSPDNYVQAPGFSQNFNRYAYCVNNPLIYTDPTGEFWHLIIGAVIGGTMNVIFNAGNIDNFWEGLGYFGIGAAAGALGAGVGAGVSSAIAGGSFGAGFVGSSTAMTATSSFFTGAAIGGSAGFIAGFTTGFGNGLMRGQNFGQALGSGLKDGLIGGVTGGLIGGVAGGIDAVRDGRRFFDGATVQTEILVDQNIPLVGQIGDNNCLPACVEATDRSFGGSLTQNDVRGWFGGDPNTTPLNDVDVWGKYSEVSGHKVLVDLNKGSSLPRVLTTMKNGGRVAINLNSGDVGHSVVIKSITQKTITKINGNVVTKYIYRAMNPGNGGSIMRVSGSSIRNAYNIFYIFK